MGECSFTATALGIAFIVLKLCHVIAWSWWWVLCPFWIGLAIALAVVAAIGVFMLFVGLVTILAAIISK